MKKTALVLGGGGFIGGHLAKRLKEEGCFVKIVDLKKHQFFDQKDICDEFILGDLTDAEVVKNAFDQSFDEVYQLAADMGGAEYLFSGLNDANVMASSALINLHVAKASVAASVKKVFFSSSACVYPEFNQLDPQNPICAEDSVYPAQPDSEYGWEKLFSERIYLAFHRNYQLNIRIARFHNIFGPYGTWMGGKEKVPAAMIRKVVQCQENGEIEVWGNGEQTRSFLYVEDCVDAVLALMEADFFQPVNIGSEKLVSINELAKIAIGFTDKSIRIKNLQGEEFEEKYGFPCPIGVNGRISDNQLFNKHIRKMDHLPLEKGLKITYDWILSQVEKL